MWGETLSEREGEAMQKVLPELNEVQWAKPLTERIDRDGGLKSENMPLLFEARFAHGLYLQGLTPEYEYRGGVGDTVIDFRVPGNPDWLFELTSIRPSEAVKRATLDRGPFISRFLQSPRMANNAGQNEESEEGELLLAQQKIGEKVFNGDQVVKFPESSSSTCGPFWTAATNGTIGKLPTVQTGCRKNSCTAGYTKVSGSRFAGYSSPSVREELHRTYGNAFTSWRLWPKKRTNPEKYLNRFFFFPIRHY
jgi:hypothetical protein